MESSDSYDSGGGVSGRNEGGGGGGGRGVICIDYEGRPASSEDVVDGYGDEDDEVRGHLLPDIAANQERMT